MPLVRGNVGEAILPGTSGKFFELGRRCFYFSPESRVGFSLKPFFKTAPEWSKTAFFDGLKSRLVIETNGIFKMQLRVAQKPGFGDIFLKPPKMAGESSSTRKFRKRYFYNEQPPLHPSFSY